MAANALSPDVSKLSLMTDDGSDASLHSHQNSLLHSNAEPLHAPHTSGSTSCDSASQATDVQLHKSTLTSQDLQAIAASPVNAKEREDMHLFIDHAMDISSFVHAYPSFDSQTIRRVMHRVADRMPIVFRVADIVTDDQMGLPMLRWTTSSGRKYFLSDAEYDFLFDSERCKMLGKISRSKVAEVNELLEKLLRHAEARPLDATVTSIQQDLVSLVRMTLECEVEHAGEPRSCASHVEAAEPSRSISLVQFLISETHLLLEDIQQKRREWVEMYEEILDAEQTLTAEIAVQYLSSTEGATRLAKHDERRTEFLARAALQPPPVLRVIDIKSSCEAKKVVLRDYWAHEVLQQVGFSAISHTYGMAVYDVFNCQCSTVLSFPYHVRPRCLVGPCPHDATVSQEGSETRNRVVNDILGMCENLCNAGVEYAWHDGVCIAQHDDAEVMATIKCMGWVYASAKETIIFLHYVGKPMAPLGLGNADVELTCRWHTRVWTLQEAALSKCRRYCVRVGSGHLGHCQSLEEFEKEIGLWYKDESSKVMVIDEDRFVILLWLDYSSVLYRLLANYARTRSFMDLDIMNGLEMWSRGMKWSTCLYKLKSELLVTCFDFPSAERVIILGASRESKHVGDHINSILALTGVRDPNFAASKDKDVESSTMEFFQLQEQPAGLARALFSANVCVLDADVEKHMREVRKHTWLPLLWKQLVGISHENIRHFSSAPNIQFKIRLENGRKLLELRAELLCVAVRFKVAKGGLVINRRKETERLFDGNYAPKEFCLDASVSYLKMCIAPLPHLSRFRATAPENACCDLGIANVLMYYDYDPAASSSTSRSSNDIHSSLKRIDEMKDGESFGAHLVLPMHHYRLAVEEYKSMIRLTLVKRHGHQCELLPILIVQANNKKGLHDPVSKIGCFVATSVFVNSLEGILNDDAIQFPAFTFVDNIVIN